MTSPSLPSKLELPSPPTLLPKHHPPTSPPPPTTAATITTTATTATTTTILQITANSTTAKLKAQMFSKRRYT